MKSKRKPARKVTIDDFHAMQWLVVGAARAALKHMHCPRECKIIRDLTRALNYHDAYAKALGITIAQEEATE